MGAPGQGAPHRFRKDPERTARMPRALEMYAAGATYRAIADEFGYATKQAAWSLVQDAMAEQRGKADPGAKAREEAKLDQLDTAVDGALVDLIDGGEPDVDKLTKLTQAKLRIAERRARLRGLDAPTRVRMSTVSDEDLEDLIAQAEAEAEEAATDDVAEVAHDNDSAPGDESAVGEALPPA